MNCQRCKRDKEVGDRGICDSCRAAMKIQAYNYKPRFKKLTAAEDAENQRLIKLGEKEIKFDSFLMGIELEIARIDSPISKHDQAFNTQLISPQHFYAKHDGSINGNGDGFELVSHPFTWLWMKENKKVFEQILQYNLERGYRSFSAHQCGLHIHITKTVFDSASLLIFLKLFYDNPDFWIQFTRKDPAVIAHYSSFECKAKELIQTANTMTNQIAGGSKYRAINVTDNTVELRIFRGNLSPDYFWRDLQAAKISVDFARSGLTPTIPTWRKYVLSRKKGFPELYRYLSTDKQTKKLREENQCV